MNPIIKRVLVGFVGGLITLVGVVALVAPESEWEETQLKAKRLISIAAGVLV